MMVMMHVALFLGLIALATGISLYIWSVRNQGEARRLAKFFGIVIIVLSVLDILCLGFYGVKYWKEDYFQNPMKMMEGKGKSDKMANKS